MNKIFVDKTGNHGVEGVIVQLLKNKQSEKKKFKYWDTSKHLVQPIDKQDYEYINAQFTNTKLDWQNHRSVTECIAASMNNEENWRNHGVFSIRSKNVEKKKNNDSDQHSNGTP